MTTGFPLTAAVSILNGLTPCVQSASATIPASNPQVRNGCGCAAAQARRTSTRWPTSPPWRLRWPLFCTVLTPTVLPNSFGVPPDLPFPYLFQVRGLPRYGFCALEMPETLLIPIYRVCGSLLPPVLLISILIIQAFSAARKRQSISFSDIREQEMLRFPLRQRSSSKNALGGCVCRNTTRYCSS